MCHVHTDGLRIGGLISNIETGVTRILERKRCDGDGCLLYVREPFKADGRWVQRKDWMTLDLPSGMA